MMEALGRSMGFAEGAARRIVGMDRQATRRPGILRSKSYEELK